MLRRFVLCALALACAAAALPSQSTVNLNTASRDELVTVPGIGPAKALAIVEHRKTHGPFKSVDDLKQVKGFRDKLVERLRPELTVAAAPAKSAPKSDAADAKPKSGAPAASGRIEDRPRK
ncbi:MAG: ComEA family DNA-binding protein [Vicinamibacteria bacterium]|jgi:competence ComEA-like helix-hairpin-helix protein